jgi:hypothetical protein
MRHLYRTLATAIAVIVAATPMIFANPAVSHFIATHAVIAAYLPLVSGIVYALYRGYIDVALNKKKPATTASAPPV